MMVVSNKEIFGLDVFGTLGAGDISVFGKRKGTHVILIYDVAGYGISLSFKEVSSPQDVACFIMETYDFAFG